jgi:hypothetical protein
VTGRTAMLDLFWSSVEVVSDEKVWQFVGSRATYLYS